MTRRSLSLSTCTDPGEASLQLRAGPSESRPHITLQRRGTLALNRAAFEALSRPRAVELLFDVDQRILGMRKIATTATNAYPVRGLGNGPIKYLIAGTEFTRYHKIATDSAHRWYAVLLEGVLCVDLTTKGVELSRDGRGARSPHWLTAAFLCGCLLKAAGEGPGKG